MAVTHHMSIELIPATQTRPAARPPRSPARNSDGDLTCIHEDCRKEQPTFKRLCEFNKHMDKHDRPYKCNNSACRKNPGFTYAGGLLRHQREVHGMHRTKDPFFCPHSSCNRSTGGGFSRRENLEEHLRRRHSSTSVDDDNVTAPSNITPKSDESPVTMRRLEPLPLDRKRCMTLSSADDEERGSDTTKAQEERLRGRMATMQQEHDRIRTELFQRDQHIAELLQENKKLRGILTALPPLPHLVGYSHQSPPIT